MPMKRLQIATFLSGSKDNPKCRHVFLTTWGISSTMTYACYE